MRAVEARAELTGRSPAVLVEYVLRRWLDGRGEVGVSAPSSLAIHDQDEAEADAARQRRAP